MNDYVRRLAAVLIMDGLIILLMLIIFLLSKVPERPWHL